MEDLEQRAENLSRKVRNILVTTMGVFEKAASTRQIFTALSLAIKEEVMVNWVATNQTIEAKKARRLYYISMEYLPGRILTNNVTNLGLHPLLKKVSQKLGWDYRTILMLERDPGIGNGGLGRLASCLLDSFATKRYPAYGYGLRYQYGTFEQALWEGVQLERPDNWLIDGNPWELRNDERAQIVKFSGKLHEDRTQHGERVFALTDFEEVRALPYDLPIVGYSEGNDFNVVTLRLFSTKESPHNFHLQRYNAGLLGQASENAALTDVLYPSDYHETGKRIRLKQEFLLVSSSLQDIVGRHLETFGEISSLKDKVRIQINDTHPALAVVELTRMLMQEFGMRRKEAWEATQEIVGYTNHTVLKEALEEWSHEKLRLLLPRQCALLEEINHDFCEKIRKEYPGDEGKVSRMSLIERGQVRMAPLAILGSHKVNGVAKLHSDILKRDLFRDFYELFPEKFLSITNGVSQRHWLLHCNPILAELISERIGRGWIVNFEEIERLKEFASDPKTKEAFLDVKRRNKERLIHHILHENPLKDRFGNTQTNELMLDPLALFDVQVKRVHEYKRQLMFILYLIMLYFDLKENPRSHPIKRVAIFSGKAAASYTRAKKIIRLIHAVARTVNRDETIEGRLKIVYIEDYSVKRAEVIIPAADLSEQISTAGLEASGTGNMKLAINGALTIGTEDGANIEMREQIGDANWPFSFGAKAEELQGEYHPYYIYQGEPKIKQALDALKEGFFAEYEGEKEDFYDLFEALTESRAGEKADRYFVLKDLMSYYFTQSKVEELYQNQDKWAEVGLHTLSGMGYFSIDRTAEEYAKKVWELPPTPLDQEILAKSRHAYGAYDRCRILT